MNEIKEIATLKLTDNIETENKLYREACRGLVFTDDGRLVVLKSIYGDYSVPGGGVNAGETYEETLRREVMEEAGIAVKDIVPYGYVMEYRRATDLGFELYQMKSCYFLCRIDSENHPQKLEDYEAALGMDLEKVTIDDFIEHNKKLVNDPKIFWLTRELFMIEHLKEHIQEFAVYKDLMK